MAGINMMALRQAVMANTPHTATANGSTASFSTDMVGKLRHLVVGIEPVQDLHGYDYPWPAGGGKNRFDQDTVFGNTVAEHQSDGSWYFSSNAIIVADTPIWQNTFGYTGQVTISLIRKTLNASGSGGARFKYKYSDNSTSTVYAPNSTTFANVTATSDVGKTVSAILWDFGTATNSTWLKDVQFELSASVSSYSPYSNICPITGWTGLTLNHSGADTSSPDTLNISWESEAGTVYGGTLDVVTGVLTVDWTTVDMGTLSWVYYSQYASFVAPVNNKIPYVNDHYDYGIMSSSFRAVNIWWTQSSKPDKTMSCGAQTNICIKHTGFTNAAEFKAAMSGVQLVYKLATPQTYQLPSTMVKSLIGNNHVWADTGDVESLTYWTH